VKFVHDAGAPGAHPLPALRAAVASELLRIDERLSDGEWEDPAVYVLLTNVSLSGRGRIVLAAQIQQSMPDALVVIVDARDLWAELDATPRVRMAYPQILGLRDIQELIRLGAAADVTVRSNVALEKAARLCGVFVATDAYNNALQLLEQHGFVVLTGPPEMGKTATARMISLARYTCGWDAFDCRSPADLFRLYDHDRMQVFLADDAFGSTEYRPEIAAEWAAQLEQVLELCSKRHWVIWTSRPGPLRTGLERLHLQGAPEGFPDPKQVLVDASLLSIAEKAQILYRHAKAANLSSDARALVRRSAWEIVVSPHFTPLRISRFVNQQLAAIMAEPAEERTLRLRAAVAANMQKSTSAMRTSFATLDPDARGLIIAMLDSGDGPVPLDKAEERLHALVGAPRKSARALAELVQDHFLRLDPVDE
jgi:hypothetical protein